VGQAGQRCGRQFGQLAHGQAAVVALGEGQQHQVTHVGDARVALQLGFHGGGDLEEDRDEAAPGLLLFVGQPAGLVHGRQVNNS
jgi:hypothetical protein